MAALAISNDALRDSLRPVAAPSIGGWIKKRANPWWHYLELGYTEAVCWLWARAPWQRWALSGGLGAFLGLVVVVLAAPRFRPDLEGVAAASGEAGVASPQLAVASAVVIAPLRQGVPPAAVDAVKGAEPPAAAEELALPAPDAPSSVEVTEQVVEDPAAADEPRKSKKSRGHGHGRRRATKPKSASALGQIFLKMHRSTQERAAH